MPLAPTLALRGVSKNFGMTAALTDMTLSLFPGEVHAIVGENGAGKSTMIKIMTGIHQPSSGVLEIDGPPVRLNGAKAARLAGVGPPRGLARSRRGTRPPGPAAGGADRKGGGPGHLPVLPPAVAPGQAPPLSPLRRHPAHPQAR